MCENKPSLLLHACCGPCSTTALERMCRKYNVTLYFYNPNIAPREEYLHRMQEARRLVEEMSKDLPVTFVEGPYTPDSFLEEVRGLEHEKEGGARCARCFALRLRQSALYAREHGIDLFTTTLTVSPHKNAEVINRIGAEIATTGAGAPAYLPSNFKKEDGYKRSVELSRLYGLYRQDYCGCVFSNYHLLQKT